MASAEPAGAAGPAAEARRQLTICNACRFCEGYCAVWPALERRRELTDGDLTQLANLCHDCQDCLSACMYAAPHPFDLNPPLVFSALRLASYQADRPTQSPSRRRLVTAVAVIGAAVVLLLLSGADKGFGAIWAGHAKAASPYSVLAYWLVLVAVGLPFVWGCGQLFRRGVGYWRTTATPLRRAGASTAARAAYRAAHDAATLRNLGGSGAGCSYETDRPTGARRVLHQLVVGGFTLCLAATISAGVLQDILGDQPPYPYLSVPVILGTLGGVGMIVGCAGLLALRARAGDAAAATEMVGRDRAFVVALLGLAVTGIAVELLRSTSAYGALLVVHLAVVAVCFAVAPYTKFIHALYRYLALVGDHLEEER